MITRTIKKIFDRGKTKNKAFCWSSISSRNQKKIIKNAVSESNKLQKDLYRKAKLL